MKIQSIILFESREVEDLYPFNILHCQWEVRCGAFRSFERIQHIFPFAKFIYDGRPKHLASFKARFGVENNEIKKENTLVFNSNILPSVVMFDEMLKKYNAYKGDDHLCKTVAFTYNNIPFAVYIPEEDIINPQQSDLSFYYNYFTDFFKAIHKIEIENVKKIDYLWDAIEFNSSALTEDYVLLSYRNKNHISEHLQNANIHIEFPEQIYIGANVKIASGVVLNASEGPISIDDNVSIMENSVILGPCYIGKNSLIKIGSKIYHNNSIGEVCKIGGEVENSIVHSYSNKQHEGFLGHSYICEWVNLGADTNTSDLKNTYTEIKVYLKDKPVYTHRNFLGLLCGDHFKSAINTQFTTGTVAGICGISFDAGFLARSLPSFAWGGKHSTSTYHIDKALEIAKTVMARRNKTLLREEEELIRMEYETAGITIA